MSEERYPASMPLAERIPDGAELYPAHDHDWVESYRYLPFGADADRPLDTDEPPRTPDGEPKQLHDPSVHGAFDPELHYQVGKPGPEIVEHCSVCFDTRVRPVKQAAYKAFVKRLNAGELVVEHVSLLPLEQLLGPDWEKTK